jgi:5-methylcytosine-specific restriction endonuclease McrA
MAAHRAYPGRFHKAPLGMCRWCGLKTKDKAKFCSNVCRTHYLLRADPQRMRQYVFFRDFGICHECGKTHFYLTDDWEADHILPLFIAYGDPEFWEPTNVRLLCVKCHKKKTAEDRRKYKKQKPAKILFW